MVRNNSGSTPWFWNFVGLSLLILSIGGSVSISNSKAIDLHFAEYKFRTGRALYNMHKVSNTLVDTTKTLPIALEQKQEIQQQLEDSQAFIEQASSELNREVSKLNDAEDN